MGLSMSERRSVTRVIRGRYRRASKKTKAKILDEFVKTTGYHRKYASWILSSWRTWWRMAIVRSNDPGGEPKTRRRPAKRPRTYDEWAFKALKKVWFIWDDPCGKRMVAALRNMPAVLYKFGELEFDPEVDQKLQRISAPTIDRMLRLKGRSHTKPDSLLTHSPPLAVLLADLRSLIDNPTSCSPSSSPPLRRIALGLDSRMRHRLPLVQIPDEATRVVDRTIRPGVVST